MATVNQEFFRRVSRIPHHGVGLSVDVYQPDLFELLDALERQSLAYGYLEIFKAAQPALASVRRRLPDKLLAYHAESLWVTQPDWTTAYPYEEEIAATAGRLQALGSRWLTHECASKQMAGYAFGTYLPPLFTRAGAEVAAEHIRLVQGRLDQQFDTLGGRVPLFLFELPPLTYFAFGDCPIAEFFRFIADLTPCGMVLDIGHLWTVYRYSGEFGRKGPNEFLSEFLETFPLERVVQIHVAGLAEHEADDRVSDPARWIDAHGAPIPELLFDMLEQVLAHPTLRHLKGIALEVDNKAVPQIVREFRQFTERFAWWDRQNRLSHPARPDEGLPVFHGERSRASVATGQEVLVGEPELLVQYDLYAQIITGRMQAGRLPTCGLEPGALEVYSRVYLPHEILHWGGDLRDMFPEICRRLDRAGIALESFVGYWMREPRRSLAPYDFFLLKLDRFVDFVREVFPEAAETAERETVELKKAYQTACDNVTDESSSVTPHSLRLTPHA
ncbi:MAG: DUF692 family protein [Nitrospirae bacterium]|nr:DUF692 family protein [Nitrospirota bacterium]